MATLTLNATSFAAGASVSAYAAEGWVPGTAPSGTAVASGTVTGSGTIALSGLTEGRRYVLWDGARGVTARADEAISSDITSQTPGALRQRKTEQLLTLNGVDAMRYYPQPNADDSANLLAYVVANPEARVRGGTYQIASGIAIPQNNVTIRGEGRESTILNYTGSGAAINSSDASQIRRRLHLADLTLKSTAAGAGHRALELDNFLYCVFENLFLNGLGGGGTAIRMLGSGTKSTYFNRFVNVHAVADSVLVDLGDGCNANTWIGGILEGAGIAVRCNPATAQTSECKFIDVAMQTTHATFMQLGAGAALAKNFEFNACRCEPGASTLTLGANAARNSFLGGSYANTITISDGGVENTFVIPSLPLFQIGAVSATAKRTLDLLNANAGITLGNDALTNLYRRTAACLHTDGSLEAGAEVKSYQGGALSMRMTDSQIYQGGSGANGNFFLDSKGTGVIQLNKANGATGGTLIEGATGKVGFFNATPVTKRTLAAAATDAATTQTLANSLRQALIDLGLGA